MFKKLQKSKFLGTIENIERLLYMGKGYTSITLKERPDLKAEINVLYNIGWINFMREDLVAVKYRNKLLSYFSGFEYVLLNENKNQLLLIMPFSFIGMLIKIVCQKDGIRFLKKEY